MVLLLLGVLVLGAVGLGAAELTANNSDGVTLEMFGRHIHHVTPGAMFLIGVGTGFVVMAAVWMCVVGVRGSLRRRAERLAYEHEKWETEQRLREENARLAKELADRRRENRVARRPAPPIQVSTGETERIPGGELLPEERPRKPETRKAGFRTKPGSRPATEDDPQDPEKTATGIGPARASS
ncbi:MAG: hypothetical protein ACJ73S_29305 [Mycobacteriales bacterium]